VLFLSAAHLSAPCCECGAKPGDFCSPLCQQDCKKPGDTTWRTTGPKSQLLTVQVLTPVPAGSTANRWITITKECPDFKTATDMIAMYKKEQGYTKARVIQTTKQSWVTS
jgi:hypothetical protein